VDDNEMNRLVASTILKQYNMKIHEAVNGKEALEAIEKLRPEIVLMDIQMPVMDGFDATKVLRNSGNHIPVIAVTANAGMNDYLSKPYKEDDLISLIIKWIDLNSLRSVEPQIEKKDKNKTPVTSIEKAEYNLSNLREISRGDQEFVKNMVKLFCDQTPGEVYNMKKAFAEGDLELMGKTAHKIKPSIDNLGIESIGQTIRKLEKFGKENNRDTTIPALLDKVDQTLWRTIQGLKSEFGL
jgi:CheY-like chemotaxis protein